MYTHSNFIESVWVKSVTDWRRRKFWPSHAIDDVFASVNVRSVISSLRCVCTLKVICLTLCSMVAFCMHLAWTDGQNEHVNKCVKSCFLCLHWSVFLSWHSFCLLSSFLTCDSFLLFCFSWFLSPPCFSLGNIKKRIQHKTNTIFSYFLCVISSKKHTRACMCVCVCVCVLVCVCVWLKKVLDAIRHHFDLHSGPQRHSTEEWLHSFTQKVLNNLRHNLVCCGDIFFRWFVHANHCLSIWVAHGSVLWSMCGHLSMRPSL